MAADARANILITAEDRTKAAFDAVARGFEVIKRLFVARELYEGIKAIVEAGRGAEDSANRLTAAYRLQAQQVGLTRAQLDELADSLAAATQFNDNDIKKGEAELLKFGNIYGDVFTRALQASADLAAFNGTDVATATDALGKALANPIEGTKGLGAAVGKLNAVERDHIKTLVEQQRMLEAQNYILDLVNSHIGGTASLMNSGYTKAIEDTAKAWDKLKEAIAQTAAMQSIVHSFLEDMTQSLTDLKNIVESGSWTDSLLFLLGYRGMPTARSHAAKDITDLQDKLQELEKQRGSQGFVITDEAGNAYYGPSVDQQIEQTKKQIEDLTAAYKHLWGPPAAAQPVNKPKNQLTDQQLAFIKSIKQQTERVGDGPIAGLFAKADELHLGKGTHLAIQKLGQDIQQVADETERAKAATEDWQKAFASVQGLREATYQVQDDTALAIIGGNSGQRQKGQQLAQQNREFSQIARTLSGDQRKTFEDSFAAQQKAWGAAWDENYRVVRSFGYGYKTVLADIAEATTNTAAQISELMTDAFRGMEDALVSFVKTGKLDFRSLADSIITDLIRIQVQRSILAPLAGALGGAAGTNAAFDFFSGMFGSPASTGAGTYGPTSSGGVKPRAGGGDIAAGMPYLVGEQGPELIVPRASGTVIPNGKFGGGVHVEQINIGQGASPESVVEAFRQIRDLRGSVGSIAIAAVAEQRQRGRAGLR